MGGILQKEPEPGGDVFSGFALTGGDDKYLVFNAYCLPVEIITEFRYDTVMVQGLILPYRKYCFGNVQQSLTRRTENPLRLAEAPRHTPEYM